MKEKTNAKMLNFIIYVHKHMYGRFGSYLNHHQCKSENKHMNIIITFKSSHGTAHSVIECGRA